MMPWYYIASIVTLSSIANAFTPPGFEPASSQNLIVAFGAVPAIDGADLPRPETLNPPTIGTAEPLLGTYTIMMVDPDVPAVNVGGSPDAPTIELLHWLQPGFVSAKTPSILAGVSVYELIKPNNTSPFAAYLQPSPPNLVPHSHRYIQLLLNTTDDPAALNVLSMYGSTMQSRLKFSAVNVLETARLTPLAGNWFNVTNSTSTTPSGTSSAGMPSASSPLFTNEAEMLKVSALLGVLIAVAGMLQI